MIESRFQFGTRVREARKELHLTQTQLSQITGLGRSQISRIECGHGNTTLDTILLVANGLGTTPSELFSGIIPDERLSSEDLPTILTLSSEQSAIYRETRF